MANNNGGPAFPCKVVTGKRVVYSEEERGNVFESTFADVPGMTIRDYFAAHLNDEIDGADYALEMKEALLGRKCPAWNEDPVGNFRFEADFRAAWRGMRADAMLAERESLTAEKKEKSNA